MSDAHLSAMLELVKLFASADAQSYLLHEHQKVHVFGICTTLFIQFFGRHLFDASSQDTWPSFNGGLNEAPVEQVELSKTTPSRSRPSKSGKHMPHRRLGCKEDSRLVTPCSPTSCITCRFRTHKGSSDISEACHPRVPSSREAAGSSPSQICAAIPGSSP